jgi:hypothetical protein
MRQIYTSPRLENVEGVAKLMAEAGIQHKVSDGRSYRKVSRREFSYVPARENQQAPQPAVWVINSDDYKRAREIMLAAGLLDEAKTATSYLPEPLQFKDKPAAALPARQRIGRVRLALLFAVGAMAFWTILRMTVLR